MLLLALVNMYVIYVKLNRDRLYPQKRKQLFKSELLSSKINNCIVITGFTISKTLRPHAVLS